MNRPVDSEARKRRDAAIRSQDDEIAEHLAQAYKSGELQSAPSYGKPLAESEGWSETPPEFRLPFKILKFGVASVLLPGTAFLIALLVSSLVPGCRCDEGAGCHGCGANGLVEFMLFSGFIGALGAAMTVLPACLLLALVVAFVSGRKE